MSATTKDVRFEFEAETHTYRVDGAVWPSVTQILEPLQLLDGIPKHVLAAAAAFGTAVHHAAHLDNLGMLDEARLDEPLRPYLAAWRRFLAETGAIVVASEQRVRNARLKYCGTLDCIARIGGQRVLVDIKATAAIPPTVGAQTAGYAYAIGEERIPRRVVQLRSDGSYRSETLKSSADWNLFLSALNIHQWRASRGQQ